MLEEIFLQRANSYFGHIQGASPQLARTFKRNRRRSICDSALRQKSLILSYCACFRTTIIFNMATSYKNFKPIELDQEERRRAIVMSLINNEGKVESTLISQTLREH